MEPQNTDAPEVLETQEVAEETTEETPEITADEIQNLKAKAAKADDLEGKNKQLYERVKKAEAKAPSDNSLNQKDVLYLAKADIHEDDLDEVLDWAKFKGVTVKEAHNALKTVLDVRAEERKTAAASHTRGGQHSSSKVTGEDLLRKAEQGGDLPTDKEGLQSIFEARQKRRLQN